MPDKSQSQQAEIDARIAKKGGLIKLVRDSFIGNLGFWVGYVFVVLTLITVPFLWVLYKFIIAQTVEDRLFWGVWSLLACIMIIALKIWYWMEASRVSLMREIVQLELKLESLEDQRPI